MKKIFISGCIVALSVSASAQGFFIKAGGGFAFPQASQTLDISGNPYNGSVKSNTATTPATTSYDINKVSFTSGAHAVAEMGYMLTPFIGFSLAADLTIGGKTYTGTQTNVLNPSGAYLADASYTTQAAMPVYLLPSVIVQAPWKKFDIYMRGGIAIPLSTKLSVSQQYTYHNTFQSVELVREDLKTNTNMGFSGSGGIKYKLSGSISAFAEVNVLVSSLYAKSAKITEHTLDGDPVATLPTAGTSIKYGVNGQITATQQPTFSIPYSNVGLAVGVSISLAKPKDESTSGKE